MIRVLFEDKTRFINKLDFEGTEVSREEVLDFFKTHANLESRITNWQAKPEVIIPQIIQLMKNTSANAERKSNVSKHYKKIQAMNKDVKQIFETDRFVYIAPLNYRGAVYCDSSEIGGGGGQWCIGWDQSDEHWNRYSYGNNCSFAMIVDKTPIDDDVKNHAKVMAEFKSFDTLDYRRPEEYDGTITLWNQPDTGICNITHRGITIDICWNRNTDEEPRETTSEEEKWIRDIAKDVREHKAEIVTALKEVYDHVQENRFEEEDKKIREYYEKVKNILGPAFIEVEEDDWDWFKRKWRGHQDIAAGMCYFFVDKWFRQSNLNLQQKVIDFCLDNEIFRHTGIIDDMGNNVYYVFTGKTLASRTESTTELEKELAQKFLRTIEYPESLKPVMLNFAADLFFEIISMGKGKAVWSCVCKDREKLPSCACIMSLKDHNAISAMRISISATDELRASLQSTGDYFRPLQCYMELDNRGQISVESRHFEVPDPKDFILRYFSYYSKEGLQPLVNLMRKRWRQWSEDEMDEAIEPNKLAFWGIDHLNEPAEWFEKVLVGPYGNS